SLSVVIAGLVPAISIIRHSFAFLSEMAGTSPAMTSREVLGLSATQEYIHPADGSSPPARANCLQSMAEPGEGHVELRGTEPPGYAFVSASSRCSQPMTLTDIGRCDRVFDKILTTR